MGLRHLRRRPFSLLCVLLLVATASTGEAAVPARPTNLTAIVNASTVTLNWSPPTTGDPLTSYFLEAGSAMGASNIFSGNVGNTTQIVASAPAGTYFVRVRAVNAEGMGPPSDEVTVVILGAGPCVTPAPPTMVSAVVAGSVVTLNWTASTSATSYQLEAGSATSLANIFAGDVGNVITLSALAPSGTYFVRIRPRNACGLGSPTVEIVVVVAGLSGSTTDPSGDVAQGSPDLISAVVAVNGPNLELTARFAPGTFNPTPPSSGPGGTIVQFSFDTDENAATGHQGTDANCVNDNGVVGTDFNVVFGPGDDGGVRARVTRFVGPSCNQFAAVGSTAPGSVVLGADSMRAVVPLAMIGNDDGRLAFKVSTYRTLGGGAVTSILDRMPNPGLPPGRVPNP